MSTLLELLGLRRRPSPSPVAASPQAQALMLQAADASRRARLAGLTLNGERDARREAIDKAALAGNVDLARTRIEELTRLVDEALAWNARAAEFAAVSARVDALRDAGDHKAAGFRKALDQAETEARENRCPEAGKLLDAIGPMLTAREADWRLVRVHNVEMTKLAPRIANADAIPGRDDPTHALYPAWQRLAAALHACPDQVTETTVIDPIDLAGQRKELADALDELSRAYRAAPLPPGGQLDAREAWIEGEVAAFTQRAGPVIQKAKYVRPRTAAMEEMLAELAAIEKQPTPTWEAVLAKEERRLAKAEQILRAARTEQPLPDERKFIAAYRNAADWIEAARQAAGAGPKSVQAIAFEQEWDDFDEIRQSWDDDRFTRCLALLPQLEQAANAVMQAQEVAALQIVDDLGAAKPNPVVGGAPIAPSDNDLHDRAIAATDTIHPAVLKRMPLDKKIALLDALKAGGTLVGFPVNGTRNAKQAATDDPGRAAQRKVYAAMDLDDKFVAAEKVKREQLIAELLKDREELVKARDDWPLLDTTSRQKILQKVLDAHCKTMDFKAPANGIVIEAQGPGDNGSYHPGEDIIRINSDEAVYNDFELAMDLIIHENSHNWQGQIVARLQLPPGDPDKLTSAEDPPYTQALMFAANNAGAEIVDPLEDYAGYQKQPWEEHSWSTGPKTARMLLKALA